MILIVPWKMKNIQCFRGNHRPDRRPKDNVIYGTKLEVIISKTYNDDLSGHIKYPRESSVLGVIGILSRLREDTQ